MAFSSKERSIDLSSEMEKTAKQQEGEREGGPPSRSGTRDEAAKRVFENTERFPFLRSQWM